MYLGKVKAIRKKPQATNKRFWNSGQTKKSTGKLNQKAGNSLTLAPGAFS